MAAARHDPRRAEQVEHRVVADGGRACPKARADQIADAISHAGGGSSSGFADRAGPRARELFETIQHDFALSSRAVFYVMAGVMVLAFVVALVAMPGGRAAAAAADEGGRARPRGLALGPPHGPRLHRRARCGYQARRKP